MLELTLRQQIFKFINELRVVRKSQVLAFFKDWGVRAVRYEIKQLILGNHIFSHPGDIYCCVRNIPGSLDNYIDYLDAIEVLCLFDSKDIMWFATGDFPTEIRFLTQSNLLYDVTVFTEANWTNKCSLLPYSRKHFVPTGCEDPFNHVAVLKNTSLIPNIRPYGFSQYAIVHRPGDVDVYED